MNSKKKVVFGVTILKTPHRRKKERETYSSRETTEQQVSLASVSFTS